MDDVDRALQVLVRVFGTEQHPTVAEFYDKVRHQAFLIPFFPEALHHSFFLLLSFQAALVYREAHAYREAESLLTRSMSIRHQIFGDEGEFHNIQAIVLLASLRAADGGSVLAIPLLEYDLNLIRLWFNVAL